MAVDIGLALDLRADLKRVKQDIEFSLLNGDYPMKSDVAELLDIADDAISELLINCEYR